MAGQADPTQRSKQVARLPPFFRVGSQAGAEHSQIAHGARCEQEGLKWWSTHHPLLLSSLSVRSTSLSKSRDKTLFEANTTSVIDMIFDSCVIATGEVDVSQAVTFKLKELTGTWNKETDLVFCVACVLLKDDALQDSRTTERVCPE